MYSRCLRNICWTIIRQFQQFPFKLICLDRPTFTCGRQNPNLIPLAWIQTCCKQKIRAVLHIWILCVLFKRQFKNLKRKKSWKLQWQSLSADSTQLLQPKDTQHWAGGAVAAATTLHTAAYGYLTVTFFNWWMSFGYLHQVVCCVSLTCRRNVLPPCAGWLNWSGWTVKRSGTLVT